MKVLVIGPHPDDELLGYAGTLLRRRSEGAVIGWLLMTEMSRQGTHAARAARERDAEIERTREDLGVGPRSLWRLGHTTTSLDQVPMAQLVGEIARIIGVFGPEEILVPHPGDAHSDLRRTLDAVAASTKWFRQPTVERVLAYETPSETGFGGSSAPPFQPHVFIDISQWLEEKLRILRNYPSELDVFPFPRSEEAVRALATHRGAAGGFVAAEAFEVVRWRSPAASPR